MSYLVVIVVAFIASGLTFFSGFGLGTLLLPAFALFFPAEHAVALTAVVHFLNGLFKLGLVARYANLGIVLRFGVPAILASLLGAALLVWLSGIAPLATYRILGREAQVTPVKVVVGGLLLLFGLVDLLPHTEGLSFSPRYLPLDGALSGFFGGLSGMQGALRSAFLMRTNLPKEARSSPLGSSSRRWSTSRVSACTSERSHASTPISTTRSWRAPSSRPSLGPWPATDGFAR